MKIEKYVYIDDPASPSSPGFIQNATITIKNQRQLSLEDSDGPNQSRKMIIRDPNLLGLKSDEQMHADDFFNRVLTTCNLLLKHYRLSTVAADTIPVDISRAGERDVTRVENEDGVETFVVHVDLGLRIQVAIEDCGNDEIDEERVRMILCMLHKVYDAKDPPAMVGNIRESLKAYSRGIAARDQEGVLGGLYVALEKAVNFNRDVSGAEFDLKVRDLLGDESLPIGDIRKTNDRLKHISSKDQFSNQTDREGMRQHIASLRHAAAKIILFRLEEVARQIKNMS